MPSPEPVSASRHSNEAPAAHEITRFRLPELPVRSLHSAAAATAWQRARPHAQLDADGDTEDPELPAGDSPESRWGGGSEAQEVFHGDGLLALQAAFSQDIATMDQIAQVNW